MLDTIHLNKSNHAIYYKQICMIMSNNIDSIFCADKKLAHSYSYHSCALRKKWKVTDANMKLKNTARC